MSAIVILNRFDITPSGKLVAERPDIGTKAYYENVEYTIEKIDLDDGFSVHWHGEDGGIISLEEYIELIND